MFKGRNEICHLPSRRQDSFTAQFRMFSKTSSTNFNKSQAQLAQLPGGHSVHPCVPLEEEFENVPKGHGRNLSSVGSFSGTRLNPEANRAEIKALLLGVSGS